MFQALLCPSSGARDYDVVYHISRVVLGLLYVGGEVELGWCGVRVARFSLEPRHIRVCKSIHNVSLSKLFQGGH
jgi:hypothetical protein